MDNKTYKKEALRTNSPNYIDSAKRAVGGPVNGCKSTSMDLLHASMGLTTEASEFQDALKKHIFYGKPLDEVNLKEEIGDIMWYCAIALEALNTNFESVMETNISKLKARYPDKFSESDAKNRDLSKERQILENGK